MTFQEYRVKIITEMQLGSLQGKKWFCIKGGAPKPTGAPSSKNEGQKGLFSSHLNRKGILNACVMQRGYQAMYQH